MSQSAASEKVTDLSNKDLQYRIEAHPDDKANEANEENQFDVLALNLVRAEEALSSPYSFELKVASNSSGCASFCHQWLGKRVTLTIGTNVPNGDKKDIEPLRKIHGIVLSVISGPVELYDDKAEGWYKLIIGPEFETACYSRNRAVYRSDSSELKFTEDGTEPAVTLKNSDTTENNTARCSVLKAITERWGTECTVSSEAQKRIPDYLQLVQNDESDYNFFCRLLATWGLGYYWEMGEKKESIYVYDVLGGEETSKDDALPCMYSRNATSPSWSINRGYHNFGADEMKVQNYLQTFCDEKSEGTGDRVKLSLHDETWDQLQSTDLTTCQYSELHFLNRHFNAATAHSLYKFKINDENESQKLEDFSSVLNLPLGGKLTWAKNASWDDAGYILSKRVLCGDRYGLRMDFSCRVPQTVSINVRNADNETEAVSKTIGGGILPRPLEPNPDPDLAEGTPLLQGVPWDTPKPRTFMAVVTSNVPHSYRGRNFCRVRELNGEEMWVEMGSPNADSNSGIFARPRVNNVLFCMDRGDLSIPIVLSSMFRGKDDAANTLNAAPAVKLKTMDRHTRTENGTIDENSALTLRSRTHEPQRRPKDDKNEPNNLDVHDRDITSADLEFVQRPQSVKNLAEKPKPFSQIQMFSLDNGVRPIPQDDNIRNVYAVDPVIETVLGFASESDLTAGYPLCDMADAMQTANNIPISRPHLQGISMYSAGDMINQSADHQIMNAGGEIVLTAAQAITLRVGKSVIRISEYGIEVSSNAGIVYNAGAHTAYHPKDDAQDADCVTSKTIPLAGGSIMVNNAGVYSRGPYIANTAVNMFAANTILGSAFTLSDFSGKLFAPSVKIIGGAALEKTMTSLYKDGIFGVGDIAKDAQPPAVYTGDLVDGYREEGYDGTSVARGCINEGFNLIGDVIGAVNTYKNLGNLVQPQGSMVKLEPEKMTLSSLAKFDYSSYSTTITSAASGFIATVENSAFLGRDVASNFSMCKTLYTWCSSVVSDIESFFHTSGDGDLDTYTPEDCDVKANPKPPKGSASGGSVTGFVFEQIAGAIGVILAIVNPAEIISQILFGSRKDKVLGVENDVKLLRNNVQTEASQLVLAKQTAVANLNNAVAARESAEASKNEVFANQTSSIASKTQALATYQNAVIDEQQATQILNRATAAVTGTHASRVGNCTMEIKS